MWQLLSPTGLPVRAPVIAFTKSEARAALKFYLGVSRLPAGYSVEKVCL